MNTVQRSGAGTNGRGDLVLMSHVIVEDEAGSWRAIRQSEMPGVLCLRLGLWQHLEIHWWRLCTMNSVVRKCVSHRVVEPRYVPNAGCKLRAVVIWRGLNLSDAVYSKCECQGFMIGDHVEFPAFHQVLEIFYALQYMIMVAKKK